MLDQDPALDVRTALETVGRELDPIAAFAIVRARDRQHRGDLGVRSNRGEVRHPERAPGRRRNAGRAVAFGRAGGAGRRAAEGQPRAVLAGVAATRVPAAGETGTGGPVAAPPAAYETAGLGVEAAVGLLDNAGAIGPVWQPVVRVSYGGARGWTGRITVAGLGTDAGAARSRTAARKSSRRSASWSSCAAFAPGRGRSRSSPSVPAPIARASWVSPAGPTSTARRATPGRRWALRAAASSCRWCARVAFIVAAQVGLTVPDNLIRLNGAEAGRTGWPALFASAWACSAPVRDVR